MPANRVLLIDDSRDSALPLAIYLQLFGHDTRIINQPELLRSAIDEFKPTIVLLDLAMPGMGGIEAAHILRSEGYTRILIAVTGFTDELHRKQATEAGFDYYFVKPIDLPALSRAIESAATGE